jgi:putative Ca2+/H+ antiporter (TMEM165/GDT1 family)
MEWKMFLTVCLTVFMAELGDKTQFATMAFASDKAANPWVVLAGASVGLVAAAAVGVVAGQLLSSFLNPKLLTWIAGGAFILIGAWTMYNASTMA